MVLIVASIQFPDHVPRHRAKGQALEAPDPFSVSPAKSTELESDKQGLDYRLILITGQPDPDIDKTLREITNDHFEIWRYNVNLKLVQDKVDR